MYGEEFRRNMSVIKGIYKPSVLFTYRKKDLPLSDFTYTIHQVNSYCNNVDIILGDFNFNTSTSYRCFLRF